MLGGKIPRALGFSTNGFEYAALIGYAIIVCWAACLRGNLAALLVIPLLVVALFLESVRTTLVMTLFACMVLWAVQGKSLKSWLPRGALAVLIGVLGLVWSLKQVQHMDVDANTQALANHNADGLLNPLDAKKSTVSIHGEMAGRGLVAGLSNPFGRGLGSTTSAASKFKSDVARTEYDLTDSFVSLGLIGGVLYTVIYIVVLTRAFASWHRQRTLGAAVIVGILVATLGAWLTVGQYPINMLVWFMIGTLDRSAPSSVAREISA